MTFGNTMTTLRVAVGLLAVSHALCGWTEEREFKVTGKVKADSVETGEIRSEPGSEAADDHVDLTVKKNVPLGPSSFTERTLLLLEEYTFSEEQEYSRNPVILKLKRDDVQDDAIVSTDTNTFEFWNEDTGVGKILKRSPGNRDAFIDINPSPLSNDAAAFLRFFRDTNTSGSKFVEFHQGNGKNSPFARFGVTEDDPTYFRSKMGLGGVVAPQVQLHVGGRIPLDFISAFEINGSASTRPTKESPITINTNDQITLDPQGNDWTTTPAFLSGSLYFMLSGPESVMLKPNIQFDFYNETGLTTFSAVINQSLEDGDLYAIRQIPFTANSTGVLRVNSISAQASLFDIEIRGLDIVADFEGAVLSDLFYDGTAGWAGSAEEALAAVIQIENVGGKLDHSTLPSFARAVAPNIVRKRRQFSSQSEAVAWAGTRSNSRGEVKIRRAPIIDSTDKGERVQQGYEAIVEVEQGVRDYRDIGAMVTLLTESVKALKEENDTLREMNAAQARQLLQMEQRLRAVEQR